MHIIVIVWGFRLVTAFRNSNRKLGYSAKSCHEESTACCNVGALGPGSWIVQHFSSVLQYWLIQSILVSASFYLYRGCWTFLLQGNHEDGTGNPNPVFQLCSETQRPYIKHKGRSFLTVLPSLTVFTHCTHSTYTGWRDTHNPYLHLKGCTFTLHKTSQTQRQHFEGLNVAKKAQSNRLN